MNVKECLRNNGYSMESDEKCSKCENKAPKETIAEKTIYIQLEFKGDDVATTINRRLKIILTRTFLPLKLTILYKTMCSSLQSKINRNPFQVINNCIYKFTCSCQNSYIDRTERKPCVQFQIHIPKSLRSTGLKAYTGAIE